MEGKKAAEGHVCWGAGSEMRFWYGDDSSDGDLVE